MNRLTYLMGLMVSCPHSKAVDSCPFIHFRNNPIDKLIEQSYEMDIQTSSELIDWHKVCLQKRKWIDG